MILIAILQGNLLKDVLLTVYNMYCQQKIVFTKYREECFSRKQMLFEEFSGSLLYSISVMLRRPSVEKKLMPYKTLMTPRIACHLKHIPYKILTPPRIACKLRHSCSQKNTLSLQLPAEILFQSFTDLHILVKICIFSYLICNR